MIERYKSDSAIIVPMVIEIDTYLYGENYWYSAIGRVKASCIINGKAHGALVNVVCGSQGNLQYDEDKTWETIRRLAECSGRTWRFENWWMSGGKNFIDRTTKIETPQMGREGGIEA